jgi:hypothetical protein
MMKTIGGSALLGAGMMVLAACTHAEESTDLDPDAVAVEVAESVDPQGKAPRAPDVTMTCAQATGGCAPVGYRNANCAVSNLKANSYVVICVKGTCPSVYGMGNANGETCFPEQKVALDGTARAFFAVKPDATYSFTTRSGGAKAGEFMATSSASISSSVGEDTQCGGQPIGCN